MLIGQDPEGIVAEILIVVFLRGSLGTTVSAIASQVNNKTGRKKIAGRVPDKKILLRVLGRYIN